MLLKRALLGLVVALATLVLAAGVHSLATGAFLRGLPGLGGLLPGRAQPATGAARPAGSALPASVPSDDTAADAAAMLLQPATDAERHGAPGATPGIYRIHEDARVRYVMKSDAELGMVNSRTHTDHLGMRVRPGPPPPPGALRLAVVGDSVAFGYGVEDDQTIAARLERLLAGVRGPVGRPVACFTVAVPSWNHRSALAFLTDHWNDVRADVVLYLPIPNDLGDSGAIYESGKLRVEPDPFQTDPLLAVSRSLLAAMEENLRVRLGGQSPDVSVLGPVALESDLTPESTRRYDDNAASIVAMARLVAAHGGKLLVVHSEQSQYAWHLDARLQRLAPELPVTFLDRWLPPEFTLIVDGHANAATCDVRANWLAADLLQRGWVERGAELPLPAVPEVYRALLGPPDGPEAELDFSTRSHAAMRDALLDEIDLNTGKGLRQVIGGLNIDFSLRMHGLFVLRANGPRVELELGPLPQRPDLYPLAVDVELGGLPAGRITVEATGVSRASLPLPPSVAPGQPFEVKLLPATWCVVEERDRSQVAALVPLRLACRAP